jgi:hypothetical protein
MKVMGSGHRNPPSKPWYCAEDVAGWPWPIYRRGNLRKSERSACLNRKLEFVLE